MLFTVNKEELAAFTMIPNGIRSWLTQNYADYLGSKIHDLVIAIIFNDPESNSLVSVNHVKTLIGYKELWEIF